MSGAKLNKELYNNIVLLKLLNTNSVPKFQLEQSPFAEDDDESESSAAATQKEVVVTGRIFPDSDIYNQGSFKIEMKILNSFPFDPPEVR
ncbi:unnamed protein product, partial [Rotaria magnacalcarata]